MIARDACRTNQAKLGTAQIDLCPILVGANMIV